MCSDMTASCLELSPSASNLISPGSHRILEQIFTQSREYSSRKPSLGAPQCPETCPEVNTDIEGAFNTIMSARDLLQQEYFRDAIALLQLASKQMRRLFQKEARGLLSYVLDTIMVLIAASRATTVPDQTQTIVNSLVRYLAESSAEIEGLSSELHIIVNLLARISHEGGSGL